jgi:hypothetical protein
MTMRTLKILPVLVAFGAMGFAATPRDAHALFCCSSVTKWVSNKASAVGNFASSTYNSAKKAATNVVNKSWSAVKSGASAVSSTVSKGYEAVKSTVSKGYDAAKRTVKKGYDASKRFAKRTWTAAKNTASKGWNYAKRGAQWVGKKTKEGAKWVGNKVKEGLSWVKDKFNILAKWGGRVLAGVKRLFDKYIKPLGTKIYDMGKKYLNQKLEEAKARSPAMREIINVIQGKQSIADAVGNLEAEYGQAGKAKLVGYLTRVAMKLLTPAIKAVVRFATNLILKVLQTPLAHAIAHALSTGIATAVATVTAGIGAFLKPVLQPLTKWTADKMLDWLRGKVTGKVADFIWSKSRGLIANYLIRPLVNRAYDGILAILKRKFPRVFGKVGERQEETGEASGGR